jgi:hypothetical protein
MEEAIEELKAVRLRAAAGRPEMSWDRAIRLGPSRRGAVKE